jgi:hypothetical protein
MEPKKERKERKFIGVHFKCCNVYQRVYLNPMGTGYWGACPRCGKQVRFVIGSGGSDERFFEAR